MKSHEYMQQLEIQDTTLSANRAILEETVQLTYRSISVPSDPVIPVIFHIFYNNETQMISESQVRSQISALNRDYGLEEATEFQHESLESENFNNLSNQIGLQFCLPQFGGDSTAINYYEVSKPSWGFDNAMKDPTLEGVAPWNPTQYLNIYVVDITDSLFVSGFAQMPGAAANTDGIVIDYQMVGMSGTVNEPYHLGRTLVHLVGNYFGLYAIWGLGACDGLGDMVEDTPTHNAPNYGCPVYKHVSTCPDKKLKVEMTMNFMDNTDDACLSMFTTGQKYRLYAFLAAAREGLLGDHFSCETEQLAAENTNRANAKKEASRTILSNSLSVYPNPGRDYIQISFAFQHPQPIQIKLTDVNGRILMDQQNLVPVGDFRINTQDWNSGLYLISVYQKGQLIHAEKMAIKH